MDEAFEAWFKELYISEGFVSSKAELHSAWRAAVAAEREACARLCEKVTAESLEENPTPGGYTCEGDYCAGLIRAR